MNDMWMTILLTLDATIRLSTPLVLAAMAGLFSERSGVVDIGLEGKMLAACFASASVAHFTGSPWLALLVAVFISLCLALVHGFATITHKGDQIVSGVALNILVSGLTIILGLTWFRQGGQTPSLSGDGRFLSIDLPGAELMQNVPLIGSLFKELLSGHNILVYAAFALVPIVWWVLFHTRFGLRLRAVGENPTAVDTAGISVNGLRYRAVMIGGVLCGIAGTYIAIAHNAQFTRDMTAGAGYIALAALIFGKWRPVTVLMACLLFGFLQAFAMRIEGVQLPVVGVIPVQIIEAVPYLLTVILLAGFIGKAIPPKAIGKPYVKER
ncbi:MAG TPA: sugar ABC transporter permease [Oceanospirillaceae bacterium]|nr:sugar ABC transporter permease [Oceanospirillaceae bacterium]